MARQMKNSGIEWIGDIPAHWKLKKLKALFLERKEKNDPIKTDFILSLGAAYGVVPYAEKEGGGNKAKEDLTDYRLAYPNDIVMNSMNIISGSVGISKYFGCVSPVYYMLYPRQDNVDPNFYCYLFQTKAFQRSLLGLGNGILMKESSNGNFNTVRMRIPMEKLGVQLLPMPDFQEQKRIAEGLERLIVEIDLVMNKTNTTIEEYKKLKQSIISEVAIRGIRDNRSIKDSGIEYVGNIPAEWEVVKNSRLFRENVRQPNPNDISLSLSQADGLVATDDMKEKAMKTSTYEGWKRVCIGDLVLNRFKAHLGVLFAANLEGMVSFHYGVYEPQIPLVTKYYEYLCHSDAYRAIYANKSNGMVVGLQNLSNANFYSVKSLYPPVEEQKEIVDYLDKKCAEIDTLIAKKTALLEEMESYKKSVIYEYVTGKKEVQ